MLKSSLIEIIRSFTKEDMSRFEDFVRSPYHNKNSIVIKLYHSIKNFAPLFNSEKLEKEAIWIIIYPNKLYNYGIMKNLIHELTKLAESYLSQQSYKTAFNYDKGLVKELFRRGSFDIFNDKLTKFEKKNLPALIDSEEYLNNRVFINSMRTKYIENRKHINDNRTDVFKSLFNYFVNSFLKFAYGVYIEEQRIYAAVDYDFIKYLLVYIEKNPALIEGHVIIKLRYYILLSFLMEGDEKIFEKLISLFNLEKENLSRSDKFDIYSSVAGVYEIFYRKNILKYEKDFVKHMIEIVEKNIYTDFQNNYVELMVFTNVVAICLRNFDSQTLRKFINDNSHRIHPDSREAMLNYSNCKLAFLEKDYSKSLYCSVKIDFSRLFESVKDNVFFKLGIKITDAYSYFELKYFEELLSYIDNSIHFINNNGVVNPAMLISYLNFFKILKEITLTKLNKDKLKIPGIKEKIIKFSRKGLGYQTWLLQKCNEIENRVNR